MIDFAATTAGTFAQIIAVLLLTVSFAPEYRGSLSRRSIRGDDGIRYRVPARTETPRWVAVYYLVVITLACIALIADVLVLAVSRPVVGVPAVIFICLNGSATATLASMIFGSAVRHFYRDHDRVTQEGHDNAGD